MRTPRPDQRARGSPLAQSRGCGDCGAPSSGCEPDDVLPDLRTTIPFEIRHGRSRRVLWRQHDRGDPWCERPHRGFGRSRTDSGPQTQPQRVGAEMSLGVGRCAELREPRTRVESAADSGSAWRVKRPARGQRFSAPVWWRLTRRVESGIGVGRWLGLRGLWWLGAGSLTALRLGRRLQSSIRSRRADQSVVCCSGAQSIRRPSCSVWRRRRPDKPPRSELARACTSRPGGERKSGVSWRRSCGLGQLVVFVVGAVGQAADLAVAQPVVAECEDLAGDRDLGDLAPAAFGDRS
jgi:hypothetical protein